MQGQIQPLQCAAGVLGPALVAMARLGRWFVGVEVLLSSGLYQMGKRQLVTTAHRALPVCEWPALGMSWATERSNAAYAVRSRCAGACTGCCCQAGQVVCGGCGFAECWGFQMWRHRLATTVHSALPVCEWPSSGCNGPVEGQIQHLYYAASVLTPALGSAAGLGRLVKWGVWFCCMLEFSRYGGAAQQPQRTEPCQCVSGLPWACHGPLQGQMQQL